MFYVLMFLDIFGTIDFIFYEKLFIRSLHTFVSHFGHVHTQMCLETAVDFISEKIASL